MVQDARREESHVAEFAYHLRSLRRWSEARFDLLFKLSLVEADQSHDFGPVSGHRMTRNTFDNAFGGRIFPHWTNAAAILRACWCYKWAHDYRDARVIFAQHLVGKLEQGAQVAVFLDSWGQFWEATREATQRDRVEGVRLPERWNLDISDAFTAGPQPCAGSTLAPASERVDGLDSAAGPLDLSDERIARVDWDRLDVEERRVLFTKFRLLPPSPGIPRYWTVEKSVQLELQESADALGVASATSWRLNFGPLNSFLEAHGIDDVVFEPVVGVEEHKRIDGPGRDLERRLVEAFQVHVDRSARLPARSMQRKAWEELFDWMGEPGLIAPRDSPWDVVVVPGNRSDLELRVRLAVELYQLSSSDPTTRILLLSGSHPRYEVGADTLRDRVPIGEAEAMSWYLEHVASDGSVANVTIDSRATTTEETFLNCISHLRAVQVRRTALAESRREPCLPLQVVVATSQYHVLRAFLIANRAVSTNLPRGTSGVVQVVGCTPMFGPELILDGQIQDDITRYGNPKREHPRMYGARVFIQEALKVAGGRAAGLF